MNENTKILYIGDVPVESTTGGEMLLFKLLSNHIPDRLMVIQTRNYKAVYTISENAELKDVKYLTIKYPRLYGARFKLIHHFNSWVNYLFLFFWRVRIKRLARQFDPDLIVTVVHQFFWTTAFEISKYLKKPINIIIHDDWKGTIDGEILKLYLGGKFKILFENANRRFSVSPYMKEKYRKIYNLDSDVLYPIGFDERDIISKTRSIARLNSDSLTIGYAGSLWNSYSKNLIALCHSMNNIGGKVIAYTNRDNLYLRKQGLETDNLELNPFLPISDLLPELKSRCDILYLPMDFDREFETNMRVAFPSKIADYALLGLPLFIHAPEYSSIVKWAKQLGNLKCAEIVTTLDETDIVAALKKFEDYAYRDELGKNTLKISDLYFCPESVRRIFYS